MTDVETALSPDLLPKSYVPTTYSSTSAVPTPAPVPNPAPQKATELPAPATDSSPESTHSRWQVPSFITTPVEAVLGVLGKLAQGATDVIRSRTQVAASRARPWMEFFDLSAFKAADGLSGYVERLRINGVYFLFNYVIVGLVLSVVSVITKPIALIGAALLIWLYFQFFGAETAEDEFRFFGFSLDTHEKIGLMVILGFIFSWVTAGGFGIFISVLIASLLVALIHGCFRKPSESALPEVPTV